MIKKAFRQTVLVRALAAAFGTAALTVGVTGPVYAQSNTVGTVYGTVPSAAGTTVAIENTGTGIRRTATPDASGRFQFTSVPPGTYKVSLVKDGAASNVQTIQVLAGQGSEVMFGVQAVETLRVVAQRTTIDVSNATNGTTFTAKELEKLPIQPNLASIIQLAPNTTNADPRYSGGASFGGSGPSENAYYINGFPVTNPLTQLGSSELPFGAIGQAQILTGGFGAEFGRSIGGVVNITTKSGTNEWEAGGMVSFVPNTLRSKPKDIYFPNTGANPGTDGQLYLRRQDNKNQEVKYGAYVGGPIIQDKLFMFLSVEQTRVNSQRVAGTTQSASLGLNGFEVDADFNSRYMGKFDWNLTNDHRFEVTLIGDKPTRDTKLYGYNYATRQVGTTQNVSAHYTNDSIHGNTNGDGADVQIYKYTGNLTDKLTVTALYGQSKAKHINLYDGYDINSILPQVTVATATARAPGITYNNAQPLTGNILGPGSQDEVKSSRFDLEYALGNHTIRAGVDDNKLKSTNAGEFLAGGAAISYRFTATPTKPISLTGQPTVVASGGGLGTQGYYGRYRIFTDITNAYSDQSAQYIEDRWQVTKNLLIIPGLRAEQYENRNGDNEVFLKIKNQYNPRLSAIWDMNGDSSTKIFGSAGRYSIQIPTHIAVRGASRSTFTDQYFTYTGVDPVTGLPIGRVNITPPLSGNNEFGQAKDPNSVSAQNLKPSYQDEITLGFEKAFNKSYNYGLKGTYRKLRSTIDDFCDERPFDAYAARNKIDTSNWGGFGCASINPGEGNTFLINFNGGPRGPYTSVYLSAADIGFPEKAERTYKAVDFFVEHPLRDGWYGKINYTWSRAYGNTEGQTLSDVAQTDVAATQTWDFPEIMIGAKGKLPSDRTHQIKAYGYYQLAPEWGLGGNFLAASGRPKNCLGAAPAGLYDPGYGSSFHYCNGVLSPRGTAGNLPWDVRLDANVAYSPAAVKGLMLKMDVYNLFNKQTAQAVDEQYNVGGTGTGISPTYGRVISYTAPRVFRFTATYIFK